MTRPRPAVGLVLGAARPLALILAAAGLAACSSAAAAPSAPWSSPPPAASSAASWPASPSPSPSTSPAFPAGGAQACQAAGGYPAWDLSGAPVCAQVGYLGSDGQTYYAAVPVGPGGTLGGPADTQGTGATEQECASGRYPDLDGTGPGQGPRGVWNRQLALCLPAGWQR
jgi:hypothetical protein